MSLQEQLDLVKEQFAGDESIPQKAKKDLEDFSRQLSEKRLEERAVKEGRTMPDFILPSASGEDVRSGRILAHGPAVVVFFRGKW